MCVSSIQPHKGERGWERPRAGWGLSYCGKKIAVAVGGGYFGVPKAGDQLDCHCSPLKTSLHSVSCLQPYELWGFVYINIFHISYFKYFIFDDTLPNLKSLDFFIIRNLNSIQVLQVQVLPFSFAVQACAA